MGDISAEPSMEDILSSIKRIIAEEGEASVSARTRRVPRGALLRDRARDDRDDGADTGVDTADVLELSDPVIADEPAPEPPLIAPAPRVAAVAAAAPPPVIAAAPPVAEAIISESATAASRGSLDALSRMIVRPAAPGPAAGAETLEDMVREMLRPMLREWLDARLPEMVETMVAREIARITQGR